jgi:hypothetical protein
MEASVGRKSNRGDDDDAPRSKKRTADDDNDRPRSKRHDEDEDQKPRARKQMPLNDDDDEEHDAPPPRKRRVDDDDDDRPRARKRSNDDDDGDDRPRKKPKKKKKKSNVGVMIALSVGGLLALAGVAYGLYLLLGGSSYDTEMMAFLPADTNYLIGIEVEDLMHNEKAKSFLKKAQQSEADKFAELKKAGIGEDDISRILIGSKVGKGNGNASLSSVVVIRLKKSVTPDKVAKGMGATEQKKNDKTYYKSSKAGDQECMYFPSDTVIVITPNEKIMEPVLASSNKVLISQEVQDFAKKMSGGQIWMAMVNPEIGSSMGDPSKELKTPPEVASALKSARGIGGYANIESDKLSLGLGVLCSDSDAPSKAADPLEKNLKSETGMISTLKGMVGLFLPELKPILDDVQKSAQVSSSGNVLELTASINMTNIEPLVNKAMAPPTAPPPPPQAAPQAQPDDKQTEPKKQQKNRGKRDAKQTGRLMMPQRWSNVAMVRSETGGRS